MFRESRQVEQNARSSGKSGWKKHQFFIRIRSKIVSKNRPEQMYYKNHSKNVTWGTLCDCRSVLGRFWGSVAEPKMDRKISLRRPGFSGAFKKESYHSIFSKVVPARPPEAPGRSPGTPRDPPRHHFGTIFHWFLHTILRWKVTVTSISVTRICRWAVTKSSKGVGGMSRKALNL